jgi:O-acetyl-ADP-ribose deacetylase (regulator of RNase III)
MAQSSGTDPVEIVTDRTRKIVLDAIYNGWTGPPYDPIDLADRLGIAVQPNDSIVDAQTVPLGTNSFRIEFNPNTSPARVRFSIAHEIAHTIFPDCAEEVRHRSSRSGKVADAWQLETLCNIGAAELLMPLGHLREFDESDFTIEKVLSLKERLDVSTEAVLIRLIHLTGASAIAFAASHIDSASPIGRYRFDYVIPSRAWRGQAVNAGDILPRTTVLGDCTAIGYTSVGAESWGAHAKNLHIECVGIPPYPWSRLPRVAGIALKSPCKEAAPLYRIVRGDALAPRGDGPYLIVHIVNNQARTWGGGGFAQALRSRWPKVHDEFRDLATERANLMLGKVHFHRISGDLWVADMVAQVGYGPRAHGPRVKYGVLQRCLAEVAAKAGKLGASVHMPRIGAGNAGGSWAVIEELIKTSLCEGGLSVTVYDLPDRNAGGDSPQLSLGRL